MKNFILSFALTALLTFSEISFGAPRNYNAPTKCKKWFASWCTPPDSTRTGREVLLFRRTFQLSEKPGSFVINVSADNRFRLFVNGVSVAVGPARGDLEHWRYDTLDIGGHLKKGKNSIAAIVWNYASQAPIAQITFESEFVLDGATKAEEFVATPAGWKAKKSEAFSDAENRCAMYTGPGEKLDASKYDRSWTLPDFDDSAWPDAVKTRDALSPAGRDGENAGWSLIPREIPQLEETPARFSKIRKFSGSGKPADFINGEKFTLPANSECSIIIDNGTLTNAYPCLITNRGAGSEIKVAYAEALYDERGLKGDRNSVEGRHFRTPMPSDIFLPDGGPFEFSTLWWRTWRYVRLDIKTANEPLDIEDFYGIFTGYPFREEGYFKSSDASAGKIWDTAWRTARLCALETYIDCPYYEQLQYAGDTRIQALIFALRIGRRQADEKSHCRFRLVARFQRPGKIAPSLSNKAIHTAVRTLLGADAGRFRQTPRRLRIRTGTYRRSARGIPLVSKANRPRHRNAVPAASVLEFCGLVESARVERRIRP